MRKGLLNEYGLNLDYEFKTYKLVGKDYGNRKNANLGFLFNIRRYLRKNILNKREQQYVFCNTYTDWKRHVEEIIPKNTCNSVDVVRFLYMKKRDAIEFLDLIKAILIPIYIVFIELAGSLYDFGLIQDFIFSESTDKFLVTMLTIIVVVVMSTIIMIDSNQKIEFYKDFIDVVEEKYGLKRECK